MEGVCSFCGKRPVVAWFEGPGFRTVVDSPDRVGADEAWLACSRRLALVNANDRDGLAERATIRVARPSGALSTRDAVQKTWSRLEEQFWAFRAADLREHRRTLGPPEYSSLMGQFLRQVPGAAGPDPIAAFSQREIAKGSVERELEETRPKRPGTRADAGGISGVGQRSPDPEPTRLRPAGDMSARGQPRAMSPERLACPRARVEQFPDPLRDDFDVAVDHFDRGLVVDRVGRHG